MTLVNNDPRITEDYLIIGIGLWTKYVCEDLQREPLCKRYLYKSFQD